MVQRETYGLEVINMKYSKIKLTVEKVIVKDGTVVHVMKKANDLHIESGVLIGRDGKKYKYHVNEEQYHYISNNKYKVDYVIEFEDQSLRFPKGTKFKKAIESWRRFIPDSQLVKIEYHEITYPFAEPEEERTGYELTVDLNGDVLLKKIRPHQQEKIESFSTKSETINQLYTQLISCVDSKGSYNKLWYDDTVRIIKMHFENNEVLEFNQVFYNKKLCSADIIYNFLNDCGKLKYVMT